MNKFTEDMMDTTVPPKVITAPQPFNFRDAWVFMLGFAAIAKAKAHAVAYRGIAPRGQGLRAQARAQGYDNQSHMQQVQAALRSLDAAPA